MEGVQIISILYYLVIVYDLYCWDCKTAWSGITLNR